MIQITTNSGSMCFDNHARENVSHAFPLAPLWPSLLTRRAFGSGFLFGSVTPPQQPRGDPALSILMHLSAIAPTWALLPADFAHNVYFRQIESRCRKIVSVGRVKWIEGTKHSGKDNAAWYLFDGGHVGVTVFHGRAA